MFFALREVDHHYIDSMALTIYYVKFQMTKSHLQWDLIQQLVGCQSNSFSRKHKISNNVDIGVTCVTWEISDLHMVMPYWFSPNDPSPRLNSTGTKDNLRISQVALASMAQRDSNGWCPEFNAHWYNILLLDFFLFLHSKALDVNIAIIANSVCSWKTRMPRVWDIWDHFRHAIYIDSR